jgi:hypothetical protein
MAQGSHEQGPGNFSGREHVSGSLPCLSGNQVVLHKLLSLADLPIERRKSGEPP